MYFETIYVTQNYSSIMFSIIVVKKEDRGVFTIPCTIEVYKFRETLCDLREIISLMPFVVFCKIGLGNPKPTTVRILMVDRSTAFNG